MTLIWVKKYLVGVITPQVSFYITMMVFKTTSDALNKYVMGIINMVSKKGIM